MEAIGSELNLFEPAVIQSAEVGEFVQEFAPNAQSFKGHLFTFKSKEVV